jgi:dihydroneopterin aldolase
VKARVVVEDLVVHAHHGWFAHERESGRKFALSLAFSIDIRSGGTEDLASTVDYGAVVDMVDAIFVKKTHKLLETAAVALVGASFERFPAVQAVSLSIRKLDPPLPQRIGGVGVDVEITRAEFESR